MFRKSDQCTDIATSLVYYSVLALFPALLALFSVLAIFGQSEAAIRAILGIVEQVAPDASAGLGEMDADQLATTTMDRSHRTLRRVQITDAERSEKVFELLTGNDVAPRKEFIVAGSDDLSRERIAV